jgi:hypothetical protein
MAEAVLHVDDDQGGAGGACGHRVTSGFDADNGRGADRAFGADNGLGADTADGADRAADGTRAGLIAGIPSEVTEPTGRQAFGLHRSLHVPSVEQHSEQIALLWTGQVAMSTTS